jgi:hypothetical protein
MRRERDICMLLKELLSGPTPETLRFPWLSVAGA